jgi:hypothetical protein
MRLSRLVAVLLPLALLGLAGCKGNCRALSEKLCDCKLNSVDRTNCLQRAAQEEGRIGPTPEEEEVCGQLLETCECGTISTEQGKEACGLARPQ